MATNGDTGRHPTLALLEARHVDDLIDAIASMTRTLRMLDSSIRGQSEALRMHTSVSRELIELMRPKAELPTYEERDDD